MKRTKFFSPFLQVVSFNATLGNKLPNGHVRFSLQSYGHAVPMVFIKLVIG